MNSRAGGRCVVSLATLLALALGATLGCNDPGPPLRSNLAPTQSSIDSLRMLGRYDIALDLARQREHEVERQIETSRWIHRDAQREVATLARIAASPESSRAACARADRTPGKVDSLVSLGDVAAAIRLLDQQLATRRRLLSANDPEVAESLHALSRLCREHGNYARARDLDLEALGIRERSLGPRHPRVAESLQAIGTDLKAIGQNAEAMRHYRRALAIQREAFAHGSSDEMSTLRSIANLHRVAQRSDSALALFAEVLAHHRRRQPQDDRAIASVLFDTAMTLAPRGDWSAAEPLLREAALRQRRVVPRDRLGLARVLGSHGYALRHLGQNAEAESVLRESANLYEQVRRNAPIGLGRGAAFPLVSYHMLAAAQLEQGHDAEAWLSLERPLARGLVEVLIERGAIDTTGWWDDALERVQHVLGEDEALIGWLALRPGAAPEEYPFWCYCIRRDGPVRWRRVDRDPRASLASDASLDALRLELVRSATWPLHMTDTTEVTNLARSVHALRFAPFEQWLDGVRRLIVVSPDLNHGSPVAAWVDSDGRRLIDRFTITYAPSALLYTHMILNRGMRPAPSDWRGLLVGESDREPRFGRTPGPARLASAEPEIRTVAALMQAPTVLLDADATATELGRLAEAGELADFDLIHLAAHAAVDEVWTGRSALLLAPSDSSPRREVVAAARVGGDDRLEMQDILTSWVLDADLVTLSACASVSGPRAIDDGYLGLHYALLGAGARRVLASLWPVDDGATSLLMGEFYRTLLQSTASDAVDGSGERSGEHREAEALRHASQWLRDWKAEDGSTPYQHPTYWAGFILLCGGCSAPPS